MALDLTTFHSLGVKILKKILISLVIIKILVFMTQLISLPLSAQSSNVSRQKSLLMSKKSNLVSVISKIRGVGPEDYQHSSYFDEDDTYCIAVEQIYREYEDKLKFYNAIDFDDILFLVVLLFRDHPDVAISGQRNSNIS